MHENIYEHVVRRGVSASNWGVRGLGGGGGRGVGALEASRSCMCASLHSLCAE